MGFILQNQGKLKEAIKAYRKAILLKPDYAEALNNMGVALHGQGKFAEAIDDMTMSKDKVNPYLVRHEEKRVIKNISKTYL